MYGAASTAIPLVDDTVFGVALGVAPSDQERRVRRAVVDDDAFPVARGLHEHDVEGLFNRVFGVVGRDDNGKLRHIASKQRRAGLGAFVPAGAAMTSKGDLARHTRRLNGRNTTARACSFPMADRLTRRT